MHATDILGYTWDAASYCEDCTERAHPGSTQWRADDFDPADYTDSEGNELQPIFADDESDYPQHCDSCGAFLETSLTSDGYAYVVRRLADTAVRWEASTRATLAEWYDFYSDAFDAPDWQKLAEAWARIVFKREPHNA